VLNFEYRNNKYIQIMNDAADSCIDTHKKSSAANPYRPAKANLTVRQQYAAMYKGRSIMDNCRAAKRAARDALNAALKQRPPLELTNCLMSTDQYQQCCLTGRIFSITTAEYETLESMITIAEPTDNFAPVLSAMCISYYAAENLSGNILVYGQSSVAQEIAEQLGKLSVQCSTIRYKNTTSLAAIKRQSVQAGINYSAIYVEHEQPLSFVDQDLSQYTNTIVWRVAREHYAERSDVVRYIVGSYSSVELFCPSWEAASYIIGRKKLAASRAAKRITDMNYKIVTQPADVATDSESAQQNFEKLMAAVTYDVTQ
jgi:hypothetical protein